MGKRPKDVTTSGAEQGSRWRIVRDVVVFQVKCGMEALLDVTLIPLSLAAAGLDLLLGNWRRPRCFHAVLRFGERCEDWINLWGVAATDPSSDAQHRRGADSVMHDIEALIRNPRTGPDAVRTLRLWAATKLAGDDRAATQSRGGDRDGTP
ncbi:MAG TPA: hypothetical protein VNS57_08320 [Steroidobacteraceae bacterium]|nr:hypothetical protein [Steroidobacteraceae bacterium]